MISKTTIGRREYIGLPDIGIARVEAKVDTGAYTSSLHYHKLKVRRRDGEKVLIVSFRMGHKNPVIEFHKFTEKVVKSSSGHRSKRYMVLLKVAMNGVVIRTKFTLSDRSDMRYQVLLGRRMLTRRFVVDVAKKHVLDMTVLSPG